MGRGLNDIQRLACVNFGGLGDEILFSPVLAEVRKYLPDAHISLLLEDRSQAVAPLLPGIDAVIPLTVQGRSRSKLFVELIQRLRAGRYDAVICSGSSPFIPLMLAASGIPERVGFQTGASSRLLLSAEAPLERQTYAAQMYFTLATSFLAHLDPTYQAPENPLPTLNPIDESDREWARGIYAEVQPGERVILIHPGVSLVSVKKNMLKGWSDTHWAGLIQDLCAEANTRVYLVGGPDDAETVAAITTQLWQAPPTGFTNLYGTTKNLMQLAALIEQADVLACVDSSPMHIAVGLETPVVCMFGPTDEKKLLPPNDPRFVAVTQPDLACRPCLWDVRQTSCDTPVCLEVPVEAMQQAILSIGSRR